MLMGSADRDPSIKALDLLKHIVQMENDILDDPKAMHT
jgi:hypothetical protein